MKLSFKDKKEFENFCKEAYRPCPSELGFDEFNRDKCNPTAACQKCWEQSGAGIIFEDTVPKVAYLCDGYNSSCNNPDCKHTTDITHAVNFEYMGDNKYMEKETIVMQEAKVKMKSSDILMSLDMATLEVSKNNSGNVKVQYKGAEIKDGMFLVSAYGCGKDFEEACDNYLSRIRGETLVFDACTKHRREVTVLG